MPLSSISPPSLLKNLIDRVDRYPIAQQQLSIVKKHVHIGILEVSVLSLQKNLTIDLLLQLDKFLVKMQAIYEKLCFLSISLLTFLVKRLKIRKK